MDGLQPLVDFGELVGKGVGEGVDEGEGLGGEGAVAFQKVLIENLGRV